MIKDLHKALAQLSDPRFQKVILMGALGALGLIALLWMGAFQLLSAFSFFSWGVLEWLADAALIGGLIWAGIVLYPSAAVMITGLFLDDIAEAVEARHYPGLPSARRQPVGEVVFATLKFAATAILLNILILPSLLFGIYPLLFFALNGYLLSREYFELVAARRLAPDAVRRLRRAKSMPLWLGGVIITLLMMVPVINLIAPVVGTAFMVHYSVRLGAFANLAEDLATGTPLPGTAKN